MPEEIETLISMKLIQQFTNEPPTLIVSAFRRLAQKRLQLGKDLLDRIQVRTVDTVLKIKLVFHNQVDKVDEFSARRSINGPICA